MFTIQYSLNGGRTKVGTMRWRSRFIADCALRNEKRMCEVFGNTLDAKVVFVNQ